jgi:excisionase family DNA binding protein
MNNVTPAAASRLQLLTPRDLARELATTPQTIGNWYRNGVIPAKVAVGRIIRFEREAVMAALTTGRATR